MLLAAAALAGPFAAGSFAAGPGAGESRALLLARVDTAGTTTVPDLLNLTPEAARRRVEAAGLRWTVVERQPSERTNDAVVGQAPPAGRPVAAGTRVAVVIALAREMVQVPDVTRASSEAALMRLDSARLRGRITERTDDAGTLELVIGQTPAPGTWVRPGTAVRLAVAALRPAAPAPLEPAAGPAANRLSPGPLLWMLVLVALAVLVPARGLLQRRRQARADASSPDGDAQLSLL